MDSPSQKRIRRHSKLLGQAVRAPPRCAEHGVGWGASTWNLFLN